MNQLDRLQIDHLFSQVHAMQLQAALVRMAPADLIQVQWVHIEAHDTRDPMAVDVIESVSAGDTKYRDGCRTAAHESLREQLRQNVQLPDFSRLHVPFVFAKRYV
jgi:hypothetical protein